MKKQQYLFCFGCASCFPESNFEYCLHCNQHFSHQKINGAYYCINCSEKYGHFLHADDTFMHADICSCCIDRYGTNIIAKHAALIKVRFYKTLKTKTEST